MKPPWKNPRRRRRRNSLTLKTESVISTETLTNLRSVTSILCTPLWGFQNRWTTCTANGTEPWVGFIDQAMCHFDCSAIWERWDLQRLKFHLHASMAAYSGTCEARKVYLKHRVASQGNCLLLATGREKNISIFLNATCHNSLRKLPRYSLWHESDRDPSERKWLETEESCMWEGS
jgi:hypothetical protein